MHILLIVSDDDVAAQIEWMLIDEVINLDFAITGAEGVAKARQAAFDIILLDPRLPDASGPQVLGKLRQAAVNAPVVIVSDQHTVEDMSRGFGFGAEAYVALPADTSELVAVIHKVSGQARKPPFVAQVGDFTLEFVRWLKINGERVGLSGSEQRIVELLVRRKGEVISTAELCEHLYGGRDAPELGIIDVIVSHARRIIRATTGGHNLIETVWGRGYRIAEPSPPE